MTMFDVLSLSVFQLLSILSLVTSVLAVLRMGTGSLHRLSHKFETSSVAQPSTAMTAAKTWSWSSLPASFSLNALIGEDEEVRDAEKELSVSGYSAGAELVRMDWRSEKQLSRRSSFIGRCVATMRPYPEMTPQRPHCLTPSRHYRWRSSSCRATYVHSHSIVHENEV